MKKLCLLLAFITVFTLFVSCAGKDENGSDESGKIDDVTSSSETTPAGPSETTPADPSETTPAETIGAQIPDLPKVRYDDYEFVIGNDFADSTKYTTNAIISDGVNGDPINDAIYRRKVLMEEKYGIKIVDMDKDVDPMITAINAGEDIYTIITVDLSHVMTFITRGYTTDFNSIKSIDLKKPWWDQNASEKLSVAGKLPYMFSDFLITGLDNARATYFNKDMFRDLNLEDPYALVKSGDWTIDKMKEMAVAGTVELNGDGIYDHNDCIGIVNNATTFYEALLTGSDAEIVKQGKDGMPYFFCYDEKEKFINVYDRLIELFDTGDHYFITSTGQERDMFINSQALFTIDTMFMASKLRSYDINFGILPVAKWDSEQEKYLNVSPNPHAMIIPNVTTDAERTGVLLEDFSYYSSFSYSDDALIPSYYENSLKYRSTTDSESADMLDIIHDNISYVNKIAGTTLSGQIFNSFKAGNRQINSLLKKMETLQKKLLQNVLEKFN